MITVSIIINGIPIRTRGARKIKDGKKCTYLVDDGTELKHNPDDGAVVLAIKMLKTIKE